MPAPHESCRRRILLLQSSRLPDNLKVVVPTPSSEVVWHGFCSNLQVSYSSPCTCQRPRSPRFRDPHPPGPDGQPLQNGEKEASFPSASWTATDRPRPR